MDTATPRTDAEHIRLLRISEGPFWIEGKDYVAMREHSEKLERELASLRAEKERAEAKLKAQAAEAYADVEEWAAYASEYFRAKWDLAGTMQKWRDRFEPDAARKEAK